MNTVLIVESRPEVAEAVERLLATRGSRPVVVHNGVSAICFLAERRVDLVILGDPSPGMSGLDVLHTLQRASRGFIPPIAMLASVEDSREAEMPLDASPCDPNGLINALAAVSIRRNAAVLSTSRLASYVARRPSWASRRPRLASRARRACSNRGRLSIICTLPMCSVRSPQP